MNTQKTLKYIELYKRNFDRIHDMEIYKWKAVKKFQDSFDINAENFSEMLAESLSLTQNLLSAGNYFPQKMIIQNANKSPNEVRSLFKELFDESTNFIDRIERFQEGIRSVTQANYPDQELNHYQDHRAIIVYLNLMYPEDNYFYKYRMFKGLIEKLDYDYEIKMGDTANISHFYMLSDIIRSYVTEDHELIHLHHGRLSEDDYPDTSYNILTQDVIYAITNHLELEAPVENPRAQVHLTSFPVTVRQKEIQFSSSSTDYVQKAKKNKRTGDLGELFILDDERSKAHSPTVEHHSKDKGDGLGYDILSQDENGEEMYIEVKTTTGGLGTSFYVTANELERSKQDAEHFYLYRVYNFDEENNEGDLLIIQGSLAEYCINPVQFEVSLQKQERPRFSYVSV